MREVFDLASGMREAIASLRDVHLKAKAELQSEIARANVNASKVMSVTRDLKAANSEVEGFLGETKSNFSSAEETSNTQPLTYKAYDGADKLTFVNTPKTDINGVTLNKDAK